MASQRTVTSETFGGLTTYATPGTADVAAVQRYGYEEHGDTPVERLESATSRIVLIVELGSPLEVGAGRDAARHRHGFVAGLHDGPTRTWHAGTQSGVQVNLDPIAAVRVLGAPLHELAHRVDGIDAVLDARARGHVQRIASADDWSTRLALVDDWLANPLPTLTSRSARELAGVARAASCIDHHRGSVRVGAIASALGWSERRLQRAFTYWLGITPKVYAGIVRFEALARAVRARDAVDWAHAAAAAGYADQSHLSREVSRYTGSPPGRWHAALTAG